MVNLFNILKSTGLKVTYNSFDSPPQLPYLVYLFTNSKNVVADNKVYQKINSYDIELYSKLKDIASELLIENALDNADIFYDKTERYIDSEGLYQTAYEVQLDA